MLETIFRCALILMLSSAGLASAELKERPRQINLVYEVIRNGQPFATVTESYKQLDNQYHIVSVTKGLGVYALLGERKLTSDGMVTAEGLKPNHFELHQGDNAKKWLTTDFDWVHNTLNMTVKGSVVNAPLLADTQDLASFAYQLMYEAVTKKNQTALSLNVTTGKKVNLYAFDVAARDVALELPAGTFKTLQLTSAKDNTANSGDDKQIWLAAEQYYLPVRLVSHDEKNGMIEQNLKSLQIE